MNEEGCHVCGCSIAEACPHDFYGPIKSCERCARLTEEIEALKKEIDRQRELIHKMHVDRLTIALADEQQRCGVCQWCHKTFAQHRDGGPDSRMPCLGQKKGFFAVGSK